MAYLMLDGFSDANENVEQRLTLTVHCMADLLLGVRRWKMWWNRILDGKTYWRFPMVSYRYTL